MRNPSKKMVAFLIVPFGVHGPVISPYSKQKQMKRDEDSEDSPKNENHSDEEKRSAKTRCFSYCCSLV
ncbi:hypothetical protein JW979_00340 [bacterium]|nr:hypothetical protein [candidate division CSSED10-310 bacterium]